MSRSRHRSRSARSFHLFHADTTLGWRRVRLITFHEGERMVSTGYGRQVHDDNGRHIGYQMHQPGPVRNGDAVARPGAAVLTARDMELIAGQCFQFGKSRTERMSEEQRLTRVHPMSRRLLPPEDAVERAKAKLAGFTPMHLRKAS